MNYELSNHQVTFDTNDESVSMGGWLDVSADIVTEHGDTGEVLTGWWIYTELSDLSGVDADTLNKARRNSICITPYEGDEHRIEWTDTAPKLNDDEINAIFDDARSYTDPEDEFKAALIKALDLDAADTYTLIRCCAAADNIDQI